MNSTDNHSGPGGFLQSTLPSPPPSSSYSQSTTTSILPDPRSKPLKPGSAKESSFIDHVDRKLLGISRRYEKRYNTDFENEPSADPEGRGYESFGELARDMEGVIDVVWVSGTRTSSHLAIFAMLLMLRRTIASLQKPYLLTIALTICSCLPSFPFSPRASFRLLHKLDGAFFSMLQGTNFETGEALPGFEGGRSKPSTTERVRIRGVVEKTRVTMVEVAGKGGSTIDAGSIAPTDAESTTDFDEADSMEITQREENDGRWEMEVARVYEKTIEELGMVLDASGASIFR